MEELVKCAEITQKILRDSFGNTDPNSLADNIVTLSGWRYRFGEKSADANLEYERAYSERKNAENSAFLEAKTLGLTNEESRVSAEVSTRELKEKENMANGNAMRVKNAWEDIKIAIDTIKYKINAQIKERKETYEEKF